MVSRLTAVLAILLTMVVSLSAQTTATFTGGGNGTSYNDPANWSTASVPINGGGTFSVVIPGGEFVSFDVPSSGNEITNLTLGALTHLQFSANTDLEVLNNATVADARLSTLAGAVAVIPVTTYSSDALGNSTLFSANGTGSLLDLSSLSSLVGQSSAFTTQTIAASNDGVVDLSGVTTVAGPSAGGTLRFSMASGGDIDLANLETVTNTSGFVRFDVSGGSFTLVDLTTANRIVLGVSNGGAFAAANLTNFDDNRVDLASGGTFALPSAITAYTSNGLGNATIFSADGAGSTLDLSPLLSITGQASAFTTQTISATNDGVIDLSGATTLTGPSSGGTLRFNVASGGDIDLANLQTIANTNGFVRFDVSGMNYSLPTLTAAHRIVLGISNGGSLSAANLTGFDDNRVELSSGGTFTLPAAITTYTSNGLGNATLFSADGVGSLIDLTALSSLTGQATAFTTQTIAASNNGVVDLSGVTSITGPTTGGTLRFSMATGGDIDLSNLENVTNTSGFVRFDINGFNYTLPNLTSANQLNLNISNGGTWEAAGLTSFDNNIVSVSSGGQYSLPAAINSLAANTLGNVTQFAADGAGSVLDLSPLTTLAGQSTAFTTQTIAASNNGVVDLSGVTSISGPTTGGTLRFSIASGGDVNLSNLQTVSNTSGFVRFDINGLNYMLPNLTSANQLNLNISNGGTWEAAGLTSFDSNIVSVSSGGQYSLPAAITTLAANTLGNVSQFAADGAGSLLDLSPLTNLAGQSTAFTQQTIAASNDGVVDLSGVTSITGPTMGGTLRFSMASGGDIDLSNLETVINTTGFVRFDINGFNYTLPNLTSANQLNLNISNGGTWEAAGLTSFDNNIVSVSSGGHYSLPAAITTLAANTLGNVTQFAADGAGSVLDLSPLTTIAGQATAFTQQTIAASNDGVVDLSGVTSITGPSVSGTLRFTIATGGEVDLSNLDAVANTSGAVTFQVQSGGRLRVGRVTPEVDSTFTVSGAGTTFDVTGDIEFAPGKIAVSGAAIVETGGNVALTSANPGDFALSTGKLIMDGASAQRLEVGGEDLGAGGANSGNFGVGQLFVGAIGAPTTVTLADLADNGNRGPALQPEALYLYGASGGDGLQLVDGSTLVLNGVNAYAHDAAGGSQVYLNGLFGPGDVRIPFDDGFLQLTPLDFLWTSGAGGDFATAGNWDAGIVPLGADTVRWNLASVGGYSVQFAGNISTDSAVIHTDKVTFALAGNRYSVAGLNSATSVIVGQNPTDVAELTIDGGVLAARNLRVAVTAGSQGDLILTPTGRITVAEDAVVGGGVGVLNIAAGGEFMVGGSLILTTSGTLTGLGSVQGRVDNQAGSVEPGVGVGVLTLDGDYTQGAAGSLVVELAGDDNSNLASPQYDLLTVSGTAELSGELTVLLTGAYAPAVGDTFELLTAAGGVTGPFTSISTPTLGVGLVWRQAPLTSAVQIFVAPELAGDYNGDGAVDAADYTAWRDTLGQSVLTSQFADGDGDGVVGAGDYTVWRNNYGAVLSGGALHPPVAGAPEPFSLLMLLGAGATACAARGKRTLSRPRCSASQKG